jgi:Rod binding domain-containing protein
MELRLLNTLDPLPHAVGSKNASSPSIQEARRVASEFESLLIGQILQSMGSAADGSPWGGEDSSATSIVEFAQEHLAKGLAAGGGLGLAKVVEQGLRQKSST